MHRGSDGVSQLLSVVCSGSFLSLALALEVQVRPNGAPLSQATTYASDSLEDLRGQVEKSLGHQLGKAWWLADAQGMSVASWESLEALPTSEHQLSAVPEDKQFQWSPGKIGERSPIHLQDYEGAEIETIAASPRLFLMHNLFSEEESFFLIDRAMSVKGPNALTTSSTGFTGGQDRRKSAHRTSDSAFDGDSPIAKRLIKRCFEALRIPFNETLQDGLQILRYKEGQAYVPHTDWFGVGSDEHGTNFNTTTPNSTNRLATVFLYLWPPPSGGYTVFPKATIPADLTDSTFVSIGNDTQTKMRAMMQATKFYPKDSWELKLTGDCYSKLSVKPVRLGASLFYHQEPMTGQLLPEAEHGACPSFTGTKWGANLWIWNRPRQFHRPPPNGTSGALMKPPPPPKVEVIFENTEDRKAIIEFSLDGASWKKFSNLDPRTMFHANTFAGHMWRFVTEGSEEIGRWVVPREDVGMIHVLTDGTQTSQMNMEL